MNIKISIADDHPMIIDGLQNILLRNPHIVLLDSYATGEELLTGLKNAVPDVLLLDIQLPDKRGDELAPIILKKHPDISILALTNFDSAIYVNNMFALGVRGYLLKTAGKEVLIRAIETVYGGDIFVDDSLKEHMQRIEAQQAATTTLKFSPREKEILQLIADGKENTEIADILCLSLHTVRNYRNQLLRRFQVHSTVAMVQLALKLGLVR